MSLKILLEARIKQASSTWRLSIGGTPGAETLSTSLLTRNCRNVMRCLISKKIFYPGGLAPSEQTRSVIDVTDTMVENY
jgi:hypothetical protein